MNCDEIVELITEYLEDRMPAGDRARFEEHLEICEGCALYVEQMRRTIGALGALEVEALSPQARERLMDAFRDYR